MLKKTQTETGETTTILDKGTYDLTKKLVQLYIPATSALYFGLSQIWGLPGGEQVVGTLALLATFLGTLVGVSSARFQNSEAANDGAIITLTDGGGVKGYSMELKDDPENLQYKDKVTFQVKKNRMPEPPTS